MTGFEYIRKMKAKEISFAFGVEFGEALWIQRLSKEALIRDARVCPQALKLPYKFQYIA